MSDEDLEEKAEFMRTCFQKIGDNPPIPEKDLNENIKDVLETALELDVKLPPKYREKKELLVSEEEYEVGSSEWYVDFCDYFLEVARRLQRKMEEHHRRIKNGDYSGPLDPASFSGIEQRLDDKLGNRISIQLADHIYKEREREADPNNKEYMLDTDVLSDILRDREEEEEFLLEYMKDKTEEVFEEMKGKETAEKTDGAEEELYSQALDEVVDSIYISKINSIEYLKYMDILFSDDENDDLPDEETIAEWYHSEEASYKEVLPVEIIGSDDGFDKSAVKEGYELKEEYLEKACKNKDFNGKESMKNEWDLSIAQYASEHDLTLLTRNGGDFEMIKREFVPDLDYVDLNGYGK